MGTVVFITLIFCVYKVELKTEKFQNINTCPLYFVKKNKKKDKRNKTLSLSLGEIQAWQIGKMVCFAWRSLGDKEFSSELDTLVYYVNSKCHSFCSVLKEPQAMSAARPKFWMTCVPLGGCRSRNLESTCLQLLILIAWLLIPSTL